MPAAESRELLPLLENNFLKDKSDKSKCNDPIGRLIALIAVPDVPSAQSRFLRAKTELRATRIIMAVLLYRQDHNGEIPEHLATLVPNYLSQVPKDPFMETANMKYCVSNSVWTVYSVGLDLKDDHGEFDYSTDRYKQADFCFPSDEYQRTFRGLEIPSDKKSSYPNGLNHRNTN